MQKCPSPLLSSCSAKKASAGQNGQKQTAAQRQSTTQRQTQGAKTQSATPSRQSTPQPAGRRGRADSYTVETPRVQKNVRRITQHCIVNKDTGEIFILCGNEVTIGTARRSDIKLKSASTAKNHAVVVLYEDGWAIEDSGSGRPTLLNGRKVTAPQLLFDGDIIAVGDERLYYRVKTKTVS